MSSSWLLARFLTKASLLICGCLLAMLLSPALQAQQQPPEPDSTESTRSNKPIITFHAFAEAYYCLDLEQPRNHDRPLLVVFNRENEFNLNLAFVEIAGAAERYRFKFTPALGTYMQANYAAEPSALRFVYEANAGIKLVRNKEVWLDAGVLPSPFGFETAVSVGHNCLTRSLSTENSPYYVTGARLSVPLGRRTMASVFAINGWQIIQETNRAKSLAWQVQHKLAGNLLLNYSGYLGNERPALDSAGRAYRFFHDFYLNWQPGKRWDLVALFDIGVQNGYDDKSRLWHTANVTAGYRLSQTLKLGMRVEYFSDPDRVTLSGLGEDADLMGASLDVGYSLGNSIYLRVESRFLTSDKKEFTDVKGHPTGFYLYNTAALSAYF